MVKYLKTSKRKELHLEIVCKECKRLQSQYEEWKKKAEEMMTEGVRLTKQIEEYKKTEELLWKRNGKYHAVVTALVNAVQIMHSDPR